MTCKDDVESFIRTNPGRRVSDLVFYMPQYTRREIEDAVSDLWQAKLVEIGPDSRMCIVGKGEEPFRLGWP